MGPSMRRWNSSLSVLFVILGFLTVAATIIWSLRIDPMQVMGRRQAADLAGTSLPDDNPDKLASDGDIADAGLALATQFIGDIQNPQSLDDLATALRGREQRGLVALGHLLAELEIGPESSVQEIREAAELHYKMATLHTYAGRLDKASAAIENALELGRLSSMPKDLQNYLVAWLGIIALRQGEVANCIECVGPSSCIFPILPDAVHTNPAGSRQAIQHFLAYLEDSPDDLRIRWLLNLAYMTLGEYPEKVPEKFLIPLDRFRSKADIGRFVNVAPLVGLTSRGPNAAGGSIFDDFTGDGRPDILTTSHDDDAAPHSL